MGFIPIRPNWGQILGSLTISLSLLCMGFSRACWKVLLSPGMRRSWLHMTCIKIINGVALMFQKRCKNVGVRQTIRT